MKLWPKGTICVVEDQIVAGANDQIFSKKNTVVKVREYGRVMTRDIYDPYLYYFVLNIFTKCSIKGACQFRKYSFEILNL